MVTKLQATRARARFREAANEIQARAGWALAALEDLPMTNDQLIELLDRLVVVREQADELVDQVARQARAEGASWTVVGEAVGMTKQGAQQRWGA